jgi:hypothetical protein
MNNVVLLARPQAWRMREPAPACSSGQVLVRQPQVFVLDRQRRQRRLFGRARRPLGCELVSSAAIRASASAVASRVAATLDPYAMAIALSRGAARRARSRRRRCRRREVDAIEQLGELALGDPDRRRALLRGRWDPERALVEALVEQAQPGPIVEPSVAEWLLPV